MRRVIENLRENVKIVLICSFTAFIAFLFVAAFHEFRGNKIDACYSFAVCVAFAATSCLSAAIYYALEFEEDDSDD